MPQDDRKRRQLRKKFTEHIYNIGCFGCSSKIQLQCAHKEYVKPERGQREPAMLSRIHDWQPTDRGTASAKVLAELKKCGILCRTCHNKYDNPYKYPNSGHAKAPFDAKFKRSGVKAARWETWQAEHLRLAAELDIKYS